MADVVRCDSKHLWTVKDTRTNTMRTLSTGELMTEGQDNFLFPAPNGKWMKLTSSKRVNPAKVKCIEVDHPSHLFQLQPGLPLSHNTGGGKSVMQRSVVFHVIAHSREIKFLGIDLKRVELSAYKKYSNAVIGIATTLEDAVEVLRFARDTMMNRYGEMEEAHKNNFLDMQNAGSALLVMIDEAGELLDASAPAKALAESTPLPTLEDRRTIGNVRVGDHVLGEDGKWHKVLDKYEPVEQDRFEVTIKRDSDGKTETVEAGAEHLWRIYVPSDLAVFLPSHVESKHEDDGLTSAVVSTEFLSKLAGLIPEDRLSDVKFKRAKLSPEVLAEKK